MKTQESFRNNKNSLYLVSTPIGNLSDITYRAIEVLKQVDIIFAEDTRHSKILLDHYGINKKTFSYFDHNEIVSGDKILNYLKEGKEVALISDAGTPGISDPGYLIAKEAIKEGFNVVSIPGVSALLAALVVSGLALQPFTFIGFLPRKESEKKAALEIYKYRKETIIIYEAPTRINNTLKTIYDILGNRKIALAREMTKKYETIYRGYLSAFIDAEIVLKGEFVIIIEGNISDDAFKDLSIINHITLYLRQGYDEKEAMKLVAKDLNISKSEVYKEFKIRRKS
jgi:16S rRNA (cytidine1402-2'-O)-methyltransferase